MTRVVVLDHDSDVRASLSFLLDEEGYTVLETGDAADALRVIDAATDRLIVLLDLGISTEHEKLLATIAQQPDLAARHAYIGMSTSSLLSAEMQDLLTRLHVPIVPKPFDLDELLGLLARAASVVPTSTPPTNVHAEHREQ